MRFVIAFLFVVASMLLIPTASADSPVSRDLPPGLQIPDAARPGPNFDVDKATNAYLDLLSPQQRALSDAYFEGGYWLQLFALVYSLAVFAVMLWGGVARRLRDMAQRFSARPWLYTAIFGVLFTIVLFLLMLPWSIYADFVREHQYGLATQNFGGWFGDQLKSLLVSVIVIPIVLVVLYAAVRRTGDRWWVWASGIACLFTFVAMLLAPVYVEPLFNDYKPLREGAARDAVLSMARANLIPTQHVVEFDASRQTTRISANVAGFAGTTRVALNDNLLEKTSLPEIKAVVGHEMGHYVLNHGMRGSIYFSVIFVFVFGITELLWRRATARWGTRLQIRDRGDVAGLPLAMAIISILFFVATPLTNSMIRQMETEADAFGLNAAREPNGFAMVAMRLSTYRKIHPGPLEEIVFYDHPSGYTRVHSAMTWLRENAHAQPVPASEAAAQ